MGTIRESNRPLLYRFKRCAELDTAPWFFVAKREIVAPLFIPVKCNGLIPLVNLRVPRLSINFLFVGLRNER